MDRYTLRARYYPVIILFFPIIILGVFYSFQFESYVHALTSFGTVSAFTYLFSQVGRDQGKKKEKNLWESWGGTPSVQILRLNNSHLDHHTKQRYHKKLQTLCPVHVVPDAAMESADNLAADQVYSAWTRFLIAQTRDTRKYALLFKDNISYGFRRNLWGLKPYGICLTGLLLVGNYVYWIIATKSLNPIEYPLSFYYSTMGLSFFLVFWMAIVNKNWVKLTAFAYAERLCECSESL
jgi:hypothetical protein